MRGVAGLTSLALFIVNVYRLDPKPTHGKRLRRFFLRKSDAEAAAYKFKHGAIMKRFGLAATLNRPLLYDLAKRFAGDVGNPREQTRARRVLGYFCDLLTRNTCVDEVSKADGKRYIQADEGWAQASIH
jgi:hypothetical protein